MNLFARYNWKFKFFMHIQHVHFQPGQIWKNYRGKKCFFWPQHSTVKIYVQVLYIDIKLLIILNIFPKPELRDQLSYLPQPRHLPVRHLRLQLRLVRPLLRVHHWENQPEHHHQRMHPARQPERTRVQRARKLHMRAVRVRGERIQRANLRALLRVRRFQLRSTQRSAMQRSRGVRLWPLHLPDGMVGQQLRLQRGQGRVCQSW